MAQIDQAVSAVSQDSSEHLRSNGAQVDDRDVGVHYLNHSDRCMSRNRRLSPSVPGRGGRGQRRGS